MNGYYIAFDENGQAYIEHGLIRNIGQKAHKYIMKVGEGAKARYFYTKEQIEAYKKNLQDRKKTDRYARDVIKQREKQGREYQKKHEKAQKEVQYEEVGLKDFVTGGATGQKYRELEKKQKDAQKAAEKAEKEQIRQQQKAAKYQQNVNELINKTRENSKWTKQAEKWRNNPDYDTDNTAQDWHEEQAEQLRKQLDDDVVYTKGMRKSMEKLEDWHEEQAKRLQRQKEENASTLAKNYQEKVDKEVERALNNSRSYRKANEHMDKAAEQAEIAREQREIAKQYERLAEELIDDYERTSLPGITQKAIREGGEALSKLLNSIADIPINALNNTTVRVRK